jgi:hypothetical protein
MSGTIKSKAEQERRLQSALNELELLAAGKTSAALEMTSVRGDLQQVRMVAEERRLQIKQLQQKGRNHAHQLQELQTVRARENTENAIRVQQLHREVKQLSGDDPSRTSGGEMGDPTLPMMGVSNDGGLGAMGMGVEQLVELMEAAEEERALHMQYTLESAATADAPTALLQKLAEAEGRIGELEKENNVLNIENQVAIRCLDKANGTIVIGNDTGNRSMGNGMEPAQNYNGNMSLSGRNNMSTSARTNRGSGSAANSAAQQQRMVREQEERATLVEAEVERQLGRIVGQFGANGVQLPLRKVGAGTTYRLDGAGITAPGHAGAAFEVGALLKLDIVGGVLSVQVEDGSFMDFLDFLSEVRSSISQGRQ